ncbi:MAG TPA: YciI family protein [Pyrinomonadaceae bacterium]|jgi:uncharacterized protein YciI|nr:YciI family protein [Pyrinomonadaceae bacterium]
MKNIGYIFAISIICLFSVSIFQAQSTASTEKPANQSFDAELAKRLGADKMGMRNYILVILKTGPNTIPEGKERSDIFKGHFANIRRLADEGKLVVAGPFDDKNDWRGMFIFNVETIEDAQKLTATDPVIKSGLMVADYHKLYCSAALMEVGNIHKKIAKENF